MTKIGTDLKAESSYLRRLSIVYASELRLRIVTELYMREMSPKQFFEEFGGGSIPRVDSHFKILAKHGWLRFTGSKTGGKRHGATENFYRATGLVVFDDETWPLIPYSVRSWFSSTIFKQLAERVKSALHAKTFDARPERHFTWTPLSLDRLGWDRINGVMGTLFFRLAGMQAEAEARIDRSSEPTILTLVGLMAFESPPVLQDPDRSGARQGRDAAKETLMPFASRLSKIFSDEIYLRIVAELNLRAMSVPQFHRQFGDELGGLSRDSVRSRFKKLIELGWLTKVSEERGNGRRGAPEHLYFATRPAIFDCGQWAEAPDSIKTSYSWTILDHLSQQVGAAMEAGTFDARTDRHFTWSFLRLDQRGWEEVTAKVEGMFEYIFEEQESAKQRLAESGEAPVTMTVALAAFESPKDAEKQH